MLIRRRFRGNAVIRISANNCAGTKGDNGTTTLLIEGAPEGCGIIFDTEQMFELTDGKIVITKDILDKVQGNMLRYRLISKADMDKATGNGDKMRIDRCRGRWHDTLMVRSPIAEFDPAVPAEGELHPAKYKIIQGYSDL